MEINPTRRSFLSIMGAGVAAALLPAFPKFVYFDPAKLHTPYSATSATTLLAATREVHRVMADRLTGAHVHPAASLIGHTASIREPDRLREWVATHQFSAANYLEIGAPFGAQDLQIIGEGLSDKYKHHHHFTGFGVLPLPIHGIEAAAKVSADGVAVRGALAYDIARNAYRIQFDVLCG